MTRRPAEILARCNTALSHLSLAEAQALTAFRAQHKGTSAAVVAALHAGAAELYEKAAKSIRDYIGVFQDIVIFRGLDVTSSIWI